MQLSVYIITVAGMGNKTTYQQKDQSSSFRISSNTFYCHLCRPTLTILKKLFVCPQGYSITGVLKSP